MLWNWIRASSLALGALLSVVLVVACSSTDAPGAALASAGAGGLSSAGGAGFSASAGTPTAGGVPAAAGAGTGGTLLTAGAGAMNAMSGGGTTGSAAGGAAGGSGANSQAGTTSSAGAGASSGGPGSTDSVPASDTFDGTTLDASWSVFRPDLAEITVADGSLSIAPHSGALWYQASKADLVYKLVTGNFKATTTVHARKASDRTQTPAQFADVGGIMARNPSGSSENYILGVVGYAEMNQLAVEHKSTTNGQSVYGEVAFTPDAEFRMCRVGSTFTIYYRHPGDTDFGPAFAPFERPDLPATVQVGAIAYTGATAPDFVAIFDNFKFEPLGAGCTQ